MPDAQSGRSVDASRHAGRAAPAGTGGADRLN
jgi:hypothetical protein